MSEVLQESCGGENDIESGNVIVSGSGGGEVELSEQEIYEFLLGDCTELIEQYEKIRNDNDVEFRLAMVDGLTSSVANSQKVFPQIGLQSQPQPPTQHYTSKPLAGYNQGGDNLSIPASLNTKEEIERFRDKLLDEKKSLESQFIDVNIDIQRKKRQVEDFQAELANTRSAIQQMEDKVNEKDKALRILEEHVEKFKMQ